MTTEVIRTYRFRCDAAHCTVSDLSETDTAPVGWTTIDSIAHQSHALLPSVKAGRSRLSAMDARSLRSYGRFCLHLCPTHVGVLEDHTPQTDNEGGQGASVSCSCGARLAWSTPDTKALWVQHYEDVSSQQPPPCVCSRQKNDHTESPSAPGAPWHPYTVPTGQHENGCLAVSGPHDVSLCSSLWDDSTPVPEDVVSRICEDSLENVPSGWLKIEDRDTDVWWLTDQSHDGDRVLMPSACDLPMMLRRDVERLYGPLTVEDRVRPGGQL